MPEAMLVPARLRDEAMGGIMNCAREREWKRHRRLIRAFRLVALSGLLAAAVTWAGSVYDHPLDPAIMAGMAAPECAGVRAIAAGSLRPASQPDDDICRSFFLYRTTFSDATDNARAYVDSIARDRADEFRQLIGYVFLLSLAGVGVAFAFAFAFRSVHGHYWHSRRR
ncbi:putative membrane protein [Paraburkholderia xenovorans LB400]|nr:hypothetical protein [Paraburkholderia xenovorans]AIP35372.1 putative membrane protein [Paraburkholderia xenovorans LB400]